MPWPVFLPSWPSATLLARNFGHRGRALGERLAGGEADVEADGVGELGRPHRHAEVLHRAVERLGLLRPRRACGTRSACTGRARGSPGSRASPSPAAAACRSGARTRRPSSPARDWLFSPETTSTSCSSGTGLKKWMPTSRDGSLSAVAMSASFRLEVLVARIASGLAIASSLANSARFASRFSKIASMITSAWRAPCAAHVGDQPVERVAHAARVAQAALEQLRGALHRRREALGRGVLQRHAQAAHRADRGDVAAHHAGADHVHVARLELHALGRPPSGAPAGRRCGSGSRWSDARTAPRSSTTGRWRRRTDRRRTCCHSSRIAYGAG